MSAAVLTARQVVVRMIVFNMALSPRRREVRRRTPATLRKRHATVDRRPFASEWVAARWTPDEA